MQAKYNFGVSKNLCYFKEIMLRNICRVTTRSYAHRPLVSFPDRSKKGKYQLSIKIV